MTMTDDDLPVLNDIIQSGDETIIRSTRLQRVGIDRLDATSTAPFRFELPAHLQFDHLVHDMTADNEDGALQTGNSELACEIPCSEDSDPGQPHLTESVLQPGKTTDDELDLLIDEIIDKHIIALRTDLRALLERVRELP